MPGIRCWVPARTEYQVPGTGPCQVSRTGYQPVQGTSPYRVPARAGSRVSGTGPCRGGAEAVPPGPGVPRGPAQVALETAPQPPGMDGPGWAAEPSGGPDDGVDDGAGEPRWPWPLEKGTVHLAEPRFVTPPTSPQPTPTGLPTPLACRPESSQPTVHLKVSWGGAPCGLSHTVPIETWNQRPLPSPQRRPHKGAPFSSARLLKQHCA